MVLIKSIATFVLLVSFLAGSCTGEDLIRVNDESVMQSKTHVVVKNEYIADSDIVDLAIEYRKMLRPVWNKYNIIDVQPEISEPDVLLVWQEKALIDGEWISKKAQAVMKELEIQLADFLSTLPQTLTAVRAWSYHLHFDPDVDRDELTRFA